MITCMFAPCPMQLAGVCGKTVVVAGTYGHVSAHGLFGGCARALLHMWVHVCFCCVIYKEHWALISFGDICAPACHCICGYTFTIPPLNSHIRVSRELLREPFLMVYDSSYT